MNQSKMGVCNWSPDYKSTPASIPAPRVAGAPDLQPRAGALGVAGGSVARRALKRDLWTRGFINAVATHWLQHGDPTTTKDLLRCGGRVEHILAHADEEDIATLQAAGHLPQNVADEPRGKAHPHSP